jgi:hypothetical protein
VGAPSWLIDDRVLKTIEKYHFEYLSCTRAKTPFIHDKLIIPEIPSDLPCFEELDPQKDIAIIGGLIKDASHHVLPVHAEVEGGIFEAKFRELLKNALATETKIVRLIEMKSNLDVDLLLQRRHRMDLLPGRHSPCAL